LFAPMSGEVVEVNPRLKDHPEAVNSEPHDTWMVKIRLSSPVASEALLDAAAYEALIKE
jgi:glycine cleavage system H protein